MNCVQIDDPVLLKEDYFCKISYYSNKTWETSAVVNHSHSYIQLLYVLDGNCDLIIGEEKFKFYRYDFVWLNANVEHEFHVSKNCKMVTMNLCITEEKNECTISIRQMAEQYSVLYDFFINHKPFVRLQDSNEQVQNIISFLITEHNRMTQGYQTLSGYAVMILLVKIAQLSEEQFNNKKHNIYVEKALCYMYSHYSDETLCVNDIAEYISITPSYLQRLFKSEMNQTLISYLTHMRLDKACQYLKNSDIPIMRIGVYVGIDNPRYFDYLFKKSFGITPREYRQKYSKN